MIDDGNVASIMQRVENREWVEFPLQRVREVFVKIVILPVTEGVTRSSCCTTHRFITSCVPTRRIVSQSRSR